VVRGAFETIAVLLIGFSPCACGGRALAEQVCPGTDAAFAADALPDDAAADAWPTHFDATFNTEYPPPVGEYPDPPGGLCGFSDSCAAGAGLCDMRSGWCCHGRFTTDTSGAPACLCGTALGCAPSQVCCSAHGGFVSTCISATDVCNGVAF
jgi:hypothetical protein